MILYMHRKIGAYAGCWYRHGQHTKGVLKTADAAAPTNRLKVYLSPSLRSEKLLMAAMERILAKGMTPCGAPAPIHTGSFSISSVWSSHQTKR